MGQFATDLKAKYWSNIWDMTCVGIQSYCVKENSFVSCSGRSEGGIFWTMMWIAHTGVKCTCTVQHTTLCHSRPLQNNWHPDTDVCISLRLSLKSCNCSEIICHLELLYMPTTVCYQKAVYGNLSLQYTAEYTVMYRRLYVQVSGHPNTYTVDTSGAS